MNTTEMTFTLCNEFVKSKHKFTKKTRNIEDFDNEFSIKLTKMQMNTGNAFFYSLSDLARTN